MMIRRIINEIDLIDAIVPTEFMRLMNPRDHHFTQIYFSPEASVG